MPDVETVARTDSGLASALRVSVARLNRRLRNTRDADAPVGNSLDVDLEDAGVRRVYAH